MASAMGAARTPTQGSCRPFVRKSSSSPVRSDGSARRQDRGGRLDRETRDDRLSRGNAAQNAAGVVGQKRRSVISSAHLVGVLLAGQFGHAKPVADFDALHRIDRHQRRREIGVEFSIDRRAPAGRDALGHDFQHRADGRALLADIIEIIGPFARRPARPGRTGRCAKPRPSPSANGRSCAAPPGSSPRVKSRRG